MNALTTNDIECRYTSVVSYLNALYERLATNTNELDSLVRAYEASEAELDTCSRRDYQLIKQAQADLCKKIVDLYISKSKKAGQRTA